MNEVLLILFCVGLVAIQFFLHIQKTNLRYVRTIAAIVLLILVWAFGNDAPFGPKLILTGIALTTLLKEYKSRKKTGVIN